VRLRLEPPLRFREVDLPRSPRGSSGVCSCCLFNGFLIRVGITVSPDCKVTGLAGGKVTGLAAVKLQV
jgi:hypothetical protein